MDKEKHLEILEGLANNEQVISQLYEIFANKFENFHDFWMRLSNEEVMHSSWVEGLYLKVDSGELQFNETRFNLEDISKFADRVKQIIDEANAGSLTLRDALDRSVHLEEDMLERKFFEIYESDSPALIEVLNKLSTSTEKHYEAVKMALEELSQTATA